MLNLDYIQAFAGVIAATASFWAAKSWWTSDQEALSFQRSVSAAFMVALAVALSYQAGAYRGSVAAQVDMLSQTRGWAASVESIRMKLDRVGMPYGSTTNLVVPEVKYSSFDEVLLPSWVIFYLVIVGGAFQIFPKLPSRQRQKSEGETRAADEDGKGTKT